MSEGVKRQVENNVRLEPYKSKLESLRQETLALKSQIPLSSSQQSLLTSASSISNLQNQNDSYMLKIQNEQSLIKSLEKEVSSLNLKIKELRRTSNNNVEENNKQSKELQKQIKALENKIEKDYQIYNQSIAQNKRLKQKVNEIRREKVLFNSMYKQLSTEADEKRKEMKRIEEKGTQAVQEREEIKKKIIGFSKEAEKEQEIFTAEWKTLEEVIAREKKKEDFIDTDIQEETPESPCSYKIKSTLEQLLIQQCQEKIRTYDEALLHLSETSGISDLDEVVKLYLSEEMQNFSIFNHVSQLSNELEKLDIQNAETRAQIQRIEKESQTNDLERHSKTKELESNIQKAKLREEILMKQQEKSVRTINLLINGIRDIMKLVNSDKTENEHIIKPEAVNDRNLKECFGIIEDRFNKYLNDNALIEKIKANTESVRKIELEVPSIVDRDNLEHEEPMFPLTSDEIRYKSLKRLNEENEKRFRRNR